MARRRPEWGLFGGSFDPPHVGHVMAAVAAISAGGLERLLVVPCFDHPFGKSLAPYADRLAMSSLAFETLAQVEISDLESRLERPSRTLRTLQALAAGHPDVRWRLVVGADVMGDRDQWYRFDEIVALAEPLVVGRAGYAGGATPDVPNVSSTALRERLRSGMVSGGWLDVRVERYIRERGLYGMRA